MSEKSGTTPGAVRQQHEREDASGAVVAEGDATDAASTEHASSEQRDATRMVRRALTSRDVPQADLASVLGVTPQRVNTLLDYHHAFGLHLLLRLARQGGARGREVVTNVADQLHAYADGGECALTGNAVSDVPVLTKELGEFAAAALDPNTPKERLRKELVDLIEAANKALRRIDGKPVVVPHA
jgi:predicted XRE-type DNA-binding protein